MSAKIVFFISQSNHFLLFLPVFSLFLHFFLKICSKNFAVVQKVPTFALAFRKGERMKLFDRLRTHQSYSRLLDSFRGSLEPSRFLYNWIYTDMRQSRIAWPDRHHSFPGSFFGAGQIFIHHYSEEFDPGSG